MFRIICLPAALDNVFQPLERHCHWNHCMYFRLLVVTMAVMWGRRHVATLYRYLDAEHHRTRFNHFFVVERWDPEAVLRQKAQAWLRTLRPGKGDTIYLIIDDSKTAKQGQAMDAIATMKAPTTEACIRGYQYVCAILVCRGTSSPWASGSLSKKPSVRPWGFPFARRRRGPRHSSGSSPPPGVKVVVLFDPDDLCPTVVKACRKPQCHVASTLKSHRSPFKHGWKL